MIEEKVVLASEEFGSLTITQYDGLPKGLKEMVMEWRRDSQLHGIFLGITEQELTFVNGGGREYLLNAKEVRGAEANVRCTIWSRAGVEPWNLDGIGRIDFKNCVDTGTGFKVNITSGTFEMSLLNREDVDVSPTSRTAMDGQTIVPPTPVSVNLNGRLLAKEWRQRRLDKGFGPAGDLTVFNTNGENELFGYVDFGPVTVQTLTGVASFGNALHYDRPDIAATLISAEAGKVVTSASVELRLWFSSPVYFNKPGRWGLSFHCDHIRAGNVIASKSMGKELLDITQTYFMSNNTGDKGPFAEKTELYNVWKTETLRLQVGDSFDLQLNDQVHVYYRFTCSNSFNMWVCPEVFENTQLTMAALTSAAPTTAKVLPVYEALHHTIQHITGIPDALYSEYYGRTDSKPRAYAQDGKGSLKGFASGFQIRNVPDKEASMKLADQLRCLQALDNVGMGTEWIDGKRVVRIEPADYFYQEQEGVFLTRPVKFTTRMVPELLFNTYKVGYSKWEEEADNGADETNTEQQYATESHAVKAEKAIISPYRGDGTGIEQARRKQYKDKPNESSGGDSDIFVLSLWREGLNLVLRNLQGFTQVSGTVAGDTATNVLLSPKRMLLNHKRWLAMQFRQVREGRISFASGKQNTNLSSQTFDESVPVVERAHIPVADLPLPYFLPEIYTFPYPLTERERTAILRSPYKWIRFVGEDGKQRLGYLNALKYNRHTGLCEFELRRKK